MELNQQQSLNILIKAAQVAQSKGAFTLDDAEMINKAIRTFVPRDASKSEMTTQTEPETESENSK